MSANPKLIVTIILGSMLFAWMFDWLITADVAAHTDHAHEHLEWWSVASAVILIAMILSFAIRDGLRWWRAQKMKSSVAPKIEIAIDGMTCGGCVDRIESALKSSEGVESVSVELKSGLATIVGKPKLDEIKRLICSLGFQIAWTGKKDN